ncbi:aminoacyl-tRNA hydrolase [Candidatus Atribacteria bacterium HGW-Atribacteria-1]|nr:MAG: aminoacyl-tRNA hydrolase [Candidatus Atribacteria bacterium HGW-Atribacteria-1]
MKIVVGLGNPGLKYEFSRGMINNHKVILVKPQTFMNLSGRAVSKVVSYYQIPHQDLLIVYDDLNLELGQIRIRKKGSAGGHKGMESIMQYLNSEDIPRLRIGIGNPSVNFNFDCVSYVLSNFNNNDERDKIKKVIQLSTDAIKAITEGGFEKAMRKYNRKLEVS